MSVELLTSAEWETGGEPEAMDVYLVHVKLGNPCGVGTHHTELSGTNRF